MKKIKIAILDLYDGQQNEGMRCIREMLVRMNTDYNQALEWEEFEVRCKQELPSLEFTILIHYITNLVSYLVLICTKIIS